MSFSLIFLRSSLFSPLCFCLLIWLTAIFSGPPFPLFPPFLFSVLSLCCPSPLLLRLLRTLLFPSPLSSLMKQRSAWGHFPLYQYSMSIIRVGLLTLTQGTMSHLSALLLLGTALCLGFAFFYHSSSKTNKFNIA